MSDVIARNYRITRRNEGGRARKIVEIFVIQRRLNILDKSQESDEDGWRDCGVYSTFAKADAYLAQLHKEHR